MTVRELAELVKRNREAQNRYFRARTPEALDEARNLERDLDSAVAEALHPSLFPEA